MIFWILTPVPPPPPAPGYPFFGGGGGGVGVGGFKTSWPIVADVCVFGPGSSRTFFLYMDPLTHGGGLGSQLQVPPVAPPPPPIWPLASEDLAVFTLDRLFSGT